jgi:membrane carboxypeptidase/penicillin-binding protein
MEQALKDKPANDFQKPAGVVMAPMDRLNGQPAQADSSNAVEAAFRIGDRPGD